jgi:enoyl-[acyl-carrier protein] reductase I
VRYLADDYGPRGIRVNALSAGPVRTLAGAGIADARLMYSFQQRNAPLRRTVTSDEVGRSALYLLSDLASGVTGEVHHVDSGYHIVSMPTLEELKRTDEG